MKPFYFRPGTIDESVYQAIVTENEYCLPATLPPQHFIIDIGAHIGSFSWLCWFRGARNIIAFEADAGNAESARKNLNETSVQLIESAVWRSDCASPVLFNSGYSRMLPDGPDPVGINTGSVQVFATSGSRITSVPLDEVIGDKRVDILKLDCEGSEYPILLTSKKLKNICLIVGEYHNLDEIPSIARVNEVESFSVGTLVDLLTKLRFKVEIKPHPLQQFSSKVGLFFARNMDWD
ncbi:FkbM family methyltransferase [Pantanalinema rosaneae CENA516]|uniref:FkbM family methyltransferase n=1 Tax=Pantanalinema rosaneae TaxID=1620701 RepID=UPI003D6DEAFD